MKLLFIILLPLLTIALLPLKKFSRLAFYISVCLLGITNIVLLSTLKMHFSQIIINQYLVLLIDKYAWFFAMVVNICWILTTIYSYSFVRYDFQKKAKRFHFFLAFILSTVLGAAFSGNLITLFMFYILSIPLIYPLVILRDNPEAHKAGRIYLLYNLLPTLLILLPAVLITSHLTHYANFGDNAITNLSSKPITASILLAMFIIGMSKNCVFPFNRWLPNTMQTPTPIAALIHSVAAVKVGSISLIKIAVYIYHLDFLHKLNANFFMTGWLTYLCGFTALYSAYKALKTSDLKVRFSESTVSQLSYIITAILTGTPTSILGAKLHIITHSIAKCCLFFIAGFYNCVYRTVNTSQVARISPYKKWITVSVLISGLSIAGFPFLAGYLSKDLMLIEELHSGNYAAAIFLVSGSILNLFYILPLAKASFFNPKPEEIENRAIPLSMKIAIILATLIIIAISVYTYTVVRVIESF